MRKRFLALPPGTRLPKPSPVAKARSQRLVASTDLRESLKEEKLSCEKLPETDADLLRIEKRVELDKWATREKGGEESSGSSSSESEAAKTGGIKTKQRNLAARTKRRRMKYLEVKMEDIADRLSPLEEGNLLKEVRRSYGNYLLKLTDMVEKGNHAFKTEHEVDLCMALCFNQQFLEGESSHVGEKIMASWVDQNPDHGKYGRKKLPRSWRCLKGWRKMCPGRSRLGHALPVWAGILWRMIARGHRSKAIFGLLSLSTYCRPGQLLRLRKFCLVPPSIGITGVWCLLLSPSEFSETSKVGAQEDSVLLDSSYTQFLNPLLEEMASGEDQTERVWTFDYPEYLAVFKQATKDLGLNVVPYEARHSGPSIDRAKNWRTAADVKKRGMWAALSSVARYEKPARLAASWNKLSLEQRTTCSLAETYMREIFLGLEHPEIPLPKLRGRK